VKCLWLNQAVAVSQWPMWSVFGLRLLVMSFAGLHVSEGDPFLIFLMVELLLNINRFYVQTENGLK
jgi:hypothetical protein